MTWIDLVIVGAMLSLMVGGVLMSRTYMRGVSDFLVAGRTAGRYLVCVSEGVAMLGAITIVAQFEIYYNSGFTMQWWQFLMAVVVVMVTISGWVVYRFRQTRALTMAQFFEMRYSRRFRVFAGIIAWLSGLVNYGIYPAVSARFFIYFCDLPPSLLILGIEISTFMLLMFVLLSIALFFVFVGGQIAVIITDFIQGVFINGVFIAVIILFLFYFDYSQIMEALAARPEDSSFLDPMKTGETKNFNFWYFVIGVVGFVYNRLSWQGTQAYNASASSAHEARMGQVLSNWRVMPQTLFWIFIPVCAFVVMHHVDNTSHAMGVNIALSGIENDSIQSQLTVPEALSLFLPVGLLGAFVAVMICAFISTNDTYLHSWGSIFVQDVIMPLRKKPLTKKQHIILLRLSILFVAVFAFFFSLLFQQTEHIVLFFAVTGAIYAGGSGAVIVGGLYWKRGTSMAAWSAMITGSTIAVTNVILQQFWEKWYGKDFFINGQVCWFIAIVCSLTVYVLVSMLGRRQECDMDRLLNREKPSDAGEDGGSVETKPGSLESLRRLFGAGKEFTRGDKVICMLTYAWTLFWFLVFIVGTVYNLTAGASTEAWMEFWYIYVVINVVLSVVLLIWFTTGGLIDLRRMFRKLKKTLRDPDDDGRVQKS